MSEHHDRHDDFDDWLDRPAEPLPPPPGTFERISRDARRRRIGRAVTAGTIAAVVVAGVAAIPQLVRSGPPWHVTPQATQSQTTPSQAPRSQRPSGTPGPPGSTQPTPHRTDRSQPSGAPSGQQPPGGTGPTTGPTSPGPTRQLGRCRVGDLSVRLSGSGAGAGQRYTSVVFTNTSGGPCTLYGYVGAQLDGPSGPLPTDVIRDAGTARKVTLRPGGSAATALHWTVVPSGGATGCGVAPTSIEITPPDSTHQLRAAWTGGVVCGGDLHTVPVVPGAQAPPI